MTGENKTNSNTRGVSRRDFLKASAVSAAALVGSSAFPFSVGAWAAGSDEIRVGVIGCGGRGTGAAKDCVNSSEGVRIVALGDVFKDRLEGCLSNLQNDEAVKDKVTVTPRRCFVGFDAYKGVIDSGVNLVILATPPGFRPIHFKYAVEAGKHVFMEKPVAVDGPGYRMVVEAGKMASEKKLGVVAGTQRRHSFNYQETIKRIHEGAIGDILAAQCYWNQGGLWMNPRKPEWTDMEWQLRNWLYFTWLSGDHIVEQHVHNLDVINWVMGTHPIKALGMGGRQARTDPAYGHIYDHFTVEYEYPNGARLMSMCRQIDGCANNVSERVVGTKGTSNCAGIIRGEMEWKYDGPPCKPYVQEHADLIASIRAGNPLNEAQQVADSTLTAIMGRMSAYTGQEVTWEQAANSRENLMPEKLEFGPLPVPPVAIPGKTPLL
ncbi:MAG: Gfo/Idh/MocA family oxidoreductase [Armatimonadota bacterium]|nr:Gfo/Idh/MocA family oxidoreductase [Armatimonadota bacterium]